MKTKFIIYYYFVMVLILASYTNMSQSPNLLIRLGYLLVLLLPLFQNKELVPAVLICTLSISGNSFAYPFMPTEKYYYILITALFTLLGINKQNHSNNIYFLFIFIFLYSLLNDLIFQGTFNGACSRMTINLLICLLFFGCVGNKYEKSVKFLSIAFITVSLVLSYWILFVEKARISLNHIFEDLETFGWTDANYLGAIVGIGCIVAVMELTKGGNHAFYKFYCIITIIASVFSVAYLASRGATLAIVVGVLGLVLFSNSKKATKISLFVIITTLVIIMYTTSVFDLLIARVQADDGTGAGRTRIWLAKLIAFLEEGKWYNWLFGFGQREGFNLGHFGRARAFHNDFIAVLVEYGFVGLGLFIAALIYPIRKASKQMRSTISILILYLVVVGMTLEPLTGGNIAFLGFFYYITQMARNSQYERIEYIQ